MEDSSVRGHQVANASALKRILRSTKQKQKETVESVSHNISITNISRIDDDSENDKDSISANNVTLRNRLADQLDRNEDLMKENEKYKRKLDYILRDLNSKKEEIKNLTSIIQNLESRKTTTHSIETQTAMPSASSTGIQCNIRTTSHTTETQTTMPSLYNKTTKKQSKTTAIVPAKPGKSSERQMGVRYNIGIPISERISSLAKINNPSKRKVLIYGDDSGRNCSSILRRYLGSEEYKIEGWIKSGADIGELVGSIFNYVKDHNSSDSVSVFLDCKNLNDNDINNSLVKLFAIGRFTNLLICLKHSNKYQRNLYTQFYNSLNNFLSSNNNVSIHLVNNFKYNGRYRLSKLTICERIAKFINSSVCNNIVLKSVKTFNLFPVTKVPGLVCEISDSDTDNKDNVGNRSFTSETHDQGEIHEGVKSNIAVDELGSNPVRQVLLGIIDGIVEGEINNVCPSKYQDFLYPRLSQCGLTET